MKSNSSLGCECNDYSLLTANTGIANISTASPSLTGGPAAAAVLTGGDDNGTTVKSITIKAAGATKTGMVRLFVRNAAGTVTTLYREIPISTNPDLANTPTPTPVLPMIEVKLMDALKLEKDAVLLATTQNADSFNVIAEGLDEAYPTELPSSCCNYIQRKRIIGNGLLSAANTNLDGSGTIVTVLTTPDGTVSNGTEIRSITIAALQNTHEGMVRLFVSPSGTPDWSLLTEIHVPETIQSGYQPSYKQVITETFCIQPGYLVGASTHNAEGFAVTIEGDSWTYPIS